MVVCFDFRFVFCKGNLKENDLNVKRNPCSGDSEILCKIKIWPLKNQIFDKVFKKLTLACSKSSKSGRIWAENNFCCQFIGKIHLVTVFFGTSVVGNCLQLREASHMVPFWCGKVTRGYLMLPFWCHLLDSWVDPVTYELGMLGGQSKTLDYLENTQLSWCSLCKLKEKMKIL